jgi:sugar O-acyltransferase (sialic acid O-acetyltransferase NeuD family)
MKRVYIIGAGSLAREVFALISELNKKEVVYEVAGFIGNDLEPSQTVEGIEVVTSEIFKTIDVADYYFIIAIGNPKRIRMVYDELTSFNISNWLTVIHPKAYISMNVSIGNGCYVGPNTSISIGCTIGDFCIINQNCSIGHDVILKNYIVVSPGSVLSGKTECDEGVFLGSGVITVPEVLIGKNSVISANTVINRNIGENLKVGPVVRNMEIPIE